MTGEFEHAAERYDELKQNRKTRARAARLAVVNAALLPALEELLHMLTNWRHLPKGYDTQGAFNRAQTAITLAKGGG
jgi:hypothetical protein